VSILPLKSAAFPLIILLTLHTLAACNNDQVELKPDHSEASVEASLPLVAHEIAVAEERILSLLKDEPGLDSNFQSRTPIHSHPGRDALVRFLEQRSERSSTRTFSHAEEYEFSDEEEALIDEFLESQPEVEEAMALIVSEFDAAFENLDQLPLEIEVTNELGETTGVELIYPEDGYYHLGDTSISALEVLHERQIVNAAPSNGGERSLGLWRSSKRLWKNRTVRYFVDSKNAGWSASSVLRNRVKDRFYLELNDLSQVTGINFKRYKNTWWRRFRWRTSRSYVKVEFGGYESNCPIACATVGRSFKGRIHYNVTHRDLKFLQSSSYSRTNPSLSHLSHEVLHTLGMKHEHQRPDRNDYIRIDLVCDNGAKNCRAVDPNTYGSPYDYNSVMHYAAELDYCKRENIIKNSSHENRGCQFWTRNKTLYGTWLSPWDIYGVRYLYQVSNNPRPNYTPGIE